MKLISHRGNIKGPIPNKENRPSYIDSAIKLGYEVEVDIRYINGEFYLGHDTPDYKVSPTWIIMRSENLWFHCKDLESAKEFSNIDNIKYFCHSSDSFVLTSTKHIWVHDLNLNLDKTCIIPLLDEESINNYDNKTVYAICTDHINLLKK